MIREREKIQYIQKREDAEYSIPWGYFHVLVTVTEPLEVDAVMTT